MKHIAIPLCRLLLRALAFAPAPASASDAHLPRDLVSTAVNDGRFEVLAAALNQADLVDTLRGKGPFTVFAPTDEAFAALPANAVADLLRPENKAALQRVLTAHVVAGRVPASALLPAAAVKTLSGASFDLGLRVGGANVIQADVACANGIIHVIDAVLLPPAETKEAVDAVAVIHTAIEKGAPIFNAGDPAGCAAIYLAAAKRLVGAGRDTLSDLARRDMATTIEHAPTDPTKLAWALRETFDRTLEDLAFQPSMEAPLPVGFPKPKAGDVGRVVVKSYPKYRAARAEGSRQNGGFWTLFQHIKKNKVEMTAPVEMTMDKDMRMANMAFLYEAPDQGSAGTQGRVQVLDLDRIEVLSIGMRGRRTDSDLKTAKALVEKRRMELGLTAVGPWRVFGYNSPMVAADRQYWELQVPVEKE
ncbi:MAG: heme-binding protein [Planctomycetota bacterium]|nr:heme-binding protein [Planctomycetota bacterium]